MKEREKEEKEAFLKERDNFVGWKANFRKGKLKNLPMNKHILINQEKELAWTD
jgi:hypothetical protein